METTFSRPSPTRRSFGMISGRSLPATRSASMRSDMPSSRGTEKPQMSASSTPTVRPRRASSTARFTVTELLPTPPLPLAMARTRVDAGTWVSPACWRAFQRALSITSVRSSGVISPHVMCTSRTPGWMPTRRSMASLMSARSGHPPIVSLTVTSTVPSSCTSTAGTMPSDTMSLPSSGSMTDSSTATTSSRVGGGVAMTNILPAGAV